MSDNKMSRREFRENSMKLLYILEVGGDYERDTVDDEVYNAVSDLISNNDEIETLLNNSMTGYNLKRLNLVDKCILKIAVYEMMFMNLAPQIAINEALEITKIYSDIDGKQVAFNNKVLDTAKDLIINGRK